MAIELPDGTVSRTLPEQVGENTRRLDVLEGYQLESFYRDGDTLYAKRVSGEVVSLGEVSGISSITLTSGSLIFTLTDGTTINAGLVKGISNMSIDGSQHLIVAYNNGTTEDLGAIFSGNVNIAGNFTADSIIENMSGYTFVASTTTSATFVYAYAGVVKNGNKLTFVIAGTLTPSSISDSKDLGTFRIPSDIGNKLYPISSNYISYRKIYLFTANDSAIEVYQNTRKDSATAIRPVIKAGTLNNGTDYYFRYEETFLLSDNLAS